MQEREAVTLITDLWMLVRIQPSTLGPTTAVRSGTACCGNAAPANSWDVSSGGCRRLF